MAWRKKTLALFCFLVFVTLIFLQEYVNISVKLPTKDDGNRQTTERGKTRAILVKEARGNPNHGFYTIIKPAPLEDNGSLVGFSKKGKYSKHYHDIDIPKTRRKFPDLSIREKSMGTRNHSNHTDLIVASDTAIAKEHAHRIEILKNACQDVSMYRKREQRKGNLSQFLYSRAHKFAYCKVPKSGSTFWMNVFMILIRGDNYSRLISHMSRAEIHGRTQLFFTDPGRILHNNIPTVVVSRNPFSRLFSAYVDKMYIPLFWEQFRYMENVTVLPPYYRNGTVEVLKSSNLTLSSRLEKYRKKFRERGLLKKRFFSEKISPVCANNATFEDFLRFIISEINSGRALEPHWAPISHLCHPCKFNTYKIVKQESFSADVEHTLQSVGVNISNFDWLKRSLNENRAENSVPGIISVIQKKFKQKHVSACITQTEVARRLWKSFQIQGFISKEIDMPETLLHDDWHSRNNKVTEVVLDAISQKPMTSVERSKQREFFLKQAYSSISADVIYALQDIYYLDFVLFNYSMNPPE